MTDQQAELIAAALNNVARAIQNAGILMMTFPVAWHHAGKMTAEQLGEVMRINTETIDNMRKK